MRIRRVGEAAEFFSWDDITVMRAWVHHVMLCYLYNQTFTFTDLTHQHLLVNGLCHSNYASVSMHYPFCNNLVNILIYKQTPTS